MMVLTRRDFIKTGTALLGCAGLPVLSALAGDDGFIERRATKTKLKLDPSGSAVSELWTYNDSLPGPEIRVKRGERVKVRFINELDEPSSVHWHGIRIDNAMDGVSGLTQEAVPPGGTFDYDFIAPDAGTYWYHAHNMSWNQVARGLYGPLIVDEDEPVFDTDHDITLVIDDWRIGKDGAFDADSLGSLRDWSHAGRLGNWLAVNGQSNPGFKLKAGEAYRVRLINACNARVLRLKLADHKAEVVALDGQSLTEVRRLDGDPITLASAQRADLMITPDEVGEFVFEEVSGQSPFAFARLAVAGNGIRATVPKLALADIPKPDIDAAMRIPLVMTGGAMGQMGEMIYNGKPLDRETMLKTKQVWAFNGIANRTNEPFFKVSRGRSVVLELINETRWQHAMHTHGHHFRQISRDGTAIGDEPWRDTILIQRGQKMEIAFVADNPGKWLLHCHMLEHAAAGMNTWFEVA